VQSDTSYLDPIAFKKSVITGQHQAGAALQAAENSDDDDVDVENLPADHGSHTDVSHAPATTVVHSSPGVMSPKASSGPPSEAGTASDVGT